MKLAIMMIIAAVFVFGCTQAPQTADRGETVQTEEPMMDDPMDDIMDEGPESEEQVIEAPPTNPAADDSDSMVDEPVEVQIEEPKMDDSVTFQISGVNYDFLMDGQEAPTLAVKEGTTVTIVFSSEEGFHDWVVDEFDARTDKISAGGTTEVTFVADKKGTFEYYCSVGSHRANGMVGTLVVT